MSETKEKTAQIPAVGAASEQLENFVREHPDTTLIIIDTLQKVREMGGDKKARGYHVGRSKGNSLIMKQL